MKTLQPANLDTPSVARTINLTKAIPAFAKYGYYQMPAGGRTLRRIQARMETKQRAKQAKGLGNA